MFERFTTNARQVVVAANEAARELGHPYLGTEHLLLALLDVDCGSTRVMLRDVGLTRERAIADVRRFAGPEGDALGDGDAAALEAIGIDLQAVRAKVEALFGPGALQPPQRQRRHGWLRRKVGLGPFEGHVPFTGRAKKVLELSLREAIALHHNFIAPEHILLGLLRENGGLAARIISDAGLDAEALRRQAIIALSKAA